MNTQKMQLAGLVLAMGLSGTVQADILANDVVAGTPFAVTVNTGALNTDPPYFTSLNNYGQPFGHPYGFPSSSDYNSPYADNYENITLSTHTVVTPPQIGVDGSVDTYETRKLSYDIYTTQVQTFGVNVMAAGGAEVSGPQLLTGPQTFLITGQIENRIGTNLVNGGNAEVYVQLGANWDPTGYLTGVGGFGSNTTLSFRMGSTLGQLDTVATLYSNAYGSFYFDTNGTDLLVPGGDVFVPDYQYSGFPFVPVAGLTPATLDFSGTTYFEAEFSIAGDADMSLFLPTFFLQINGGMSGTPVFDSRFEETYTYLASTEVIPALLPIPEPETYAMMLAGLGLVGWAARRRISAV